MSVLYSVALTEAGNTIHIREAIPHVPYKCINPDCKGTLYRRSGDGIETHFYHHSENTCDKKGNEESPIHYETAILMRDVFLQLLNSGRTSFIRELVCDGYSDTYNKIPEDTTTFSGMQREIRSLVTQKINYDFLRDVDTVLYEECVCGTDFKPDVALCCGDRLVMPIEVFYKHEDTIKKRDWYRANQNDVLKVDVSKTSLKELRSVREEWESNKDAEAVFKKLKISVFINRRNTVCHGLPMFTTVDMIRQNIRACISRIAYKKLHVKKPILEYFPEFKYNPEKRALIPRHEQKYVLQEVERLINEGKTTIIIEAPTGVGKSAISVALINYFGDGYICTSNKQLQAQYLSDFPQLRSMIGRSNFNCKTDKCKCDAGECQKSKLYSCEYRAGTTETKAYAGRSTRRGRLYWQLNRFQNKEGGAVNTSQETPVEIPKDACPYWKCKIDAMNNPGVIHNYKYLMLEGNMVGDFGKRSVLISDEGHNIESEIANVVSLEITKSAIEKANESIEARNEYKKKTSGSSPYIPIERTISFPLIYDTKSEHDERFGIYIKWLIDLRDEVLQEIIGVFNKDIANANSDDAREYLKELRADIEALEIRISRLLNDYHSDMDNWVVKEEYAPVKDALDKDTDEMELKKLEFRPIFIKKYAYDRYFKFGDINIILSATILNFSKFAESLGFYIEDPLGSKIGCIPVSPVFPTENNKVFHLNNVNLGYCEDDEEEDRDRLYKDLTEQVIDYILDLHAGDKGIIHCNSYEISTIIEKYTRHKDRVLTHTTETRAAQLEKHINSKDPTVLCSPSMMEGVDLYDDLSRFQIMVKIPRPNFGDIMIQKRRKIETDYPDYRAAINMIQALGRSVRSHDDHAITYLLDDRFERFEMHDASHFLYKLFVPFVKGKHEMYPSLYKNLSHVDVDFWNVTSHDYSVKGKITRRINRTYPQKQKSGCW